MKGVLSAIAQVDCPMNRLFIWILMNKHIVDTVDTINESAHEFTFSINASFRQWWSYNDLIRWNSMNDAACYG
jgi:hypothetical protein